MSNAKNIHCYTSFTFSYLSRAMILAKSVRAAHPDWTIWALIVDDVPEPLLDTDWGSDFDFIMFAKDLGVPDFVPWLFKHDIVEACTAVKGHMLVHLLNFGADYVVYLDPDIAVFHPLNDIIAKLGSNSIILTPHQVTPNIAPRDIRDNELTSLQYGIFNLGFVAVRNDEDGKAFAKWWSERLYDACYDDPANGIFTDQKYIDLVPGLFGGVYVERDPGYNVASWNLSQRSVAFGSSGEILISGSPLKFYHFTKIGSAGDIMTDRYARGRSEVFEIWEWYKRAVKYHDVPGIPNKYWFYGSFTNGETITKAARILFRSRAEPLTKFSNPFNAEEGLFYQFWKKNAE